MAWGIKTKSGRRVGFYVRLVSKDQRGREQKMAGRSALIRFDRPADVDDFIAERAEFRIYFRRSNTDSGEWLRPDLSVLDPQPILGIAGVPYLSSADEWRVWKHDYLRRQYGGA